MPDAIRIAEAAAPNLTDLELAFKCIEEPLSIFERMAYVRELARRIIEGEINNAS